MVSLDSAETRHACEVLRMRLGDGLWVFDGEGRAHEGTLIEAGRSGGLVRLGAGGRSSRPSGGITLVQSIPKGKLMDWILEKATELGVARIVPVITERTIVQVDGADAERKREKWQRTVVEACKQCGQNWMPEVCEPRSLSAFLGEASEGEGVRIFGSLYPGAQPMREALGRMLPGLGVTVCIGPEGDWTRAEAEALERWGAVPVTLGTIVMRVETATMYCLSVVSNALRCAG
ncbi:MAG: hypothetical protein RLZZ142_310 [Verrucomicrobiota bacterium]